MAYNYPTMAMAAPPQQQQAHLPAFPAPPQPTFGFGAPPVFGAQLIGANASMAIASQHHVGGGAFGAPPMQMLAISRKALCLLEMAQHAYRKADYAFCMRCLQATITCQDVPPRTLAQTYSNIGKIAWKYAKQADFAKENFLAAVRHCGD